jgi:hypothetical protein
MEVRKAKPQLAREFELRMSIDALHRTSSPGSAGLSKRLAPPQLGRTWLDSRLDSSAGLLRTREARLVRKSWVLGPLCLGRIAVVGFEAKPLGVDLAWRTGPTVVPPVHPDLSFPWPGPGAMFLLHCCGAD